MQTLGEIPEPLVRRCLLGKQTVASFRFQSVGVLLTCQKFPDRTCWKRFVIFARTQLADWQARFWCATLETNQDGTHHLHGGGCSATTSFMVGKECERVRRNSNVQLLNVAPRSPDLNPMRRRDLEGPRNKRPALGGG
eukprot:9293656-Pyramimonas_sp.AAC.1